MTGVQTCALPIWTIQGFLTLNDPLSYSIIPERPYSTRTARTLHNRNKIIMIHMPLVTVNGSSSEPDIVLTPDLTDEEIEIGRAHV